MPKPFIKWVGGKTKLLPILHEHIPKEIEIYNEPFVGGGSVFLSLDSEKFKIKCFNVSDINYELINTYTMVKHYVKEVIDILKTYENTEDFYYNLRSDDKFYGAKQCLHKAAKFIYLNKTCFNGLYRVNKKGKFNAPFGKYKNPNFCDEPTLYECNKFLNEKDVIIYVSSFTDIKRHKKVQREFFYFDPPYVPISKTSNFTNYSSSGFNEKDHLNLKDVCDYIHENGGKFLQSNSDTEFVRNLYKDYDIIKVQAPRRINCKGESRGNVTELLIKNY